MIAFLLAALSGIVPAVLGPPTRVVWVSADASALVTCSLPEPSRWSCDGSALGISAGVVLVVGASVDEKGLAFVVQSGGSVGEMQVSRHGRLVTVPAGTLPEHAEPIRAIAATVDRPNARPKTTRFSVKRLDDVQVVAVSRESLWIAWDEDDPDAFIVLSGEGMANVRIPFALLNDGDVGQPLLIAASPPITLSGRVENTHGEAVGETDVELFVPFVEPPPQSSAADILALPMMQTARTQTDDGGVFAFEGTGAGPFVVSVIDPVRGRGRAVVRSALEPATVVVTSPAVASGRVLYHDLPVPAARVRFVPNVETLAAAVDVRDTASIEVQTDDEGRFRLALPPSTIGTVQVIGPDGNAARVPLLETRGTVDIDVGDISLPNHRRLTVRLDTAVACVLTAVGPLGSLGVSMITESAVSSNLHWFDLPEPGQWMLDADCGGRSVPLVPSVVSIPAEGADVRFDARVAGGGDRVDRRPP